MARGGDLNMQELLPSGKSVVTDTTSIDTGSDGGSCGAGNARQPGQAGARAFRPTVAWLFIAPTIMLLLAINIFPLIWAI